MRPQAKRSSAVNHDGSATRGSVFGRITAATRVSSPESEGSGAPSHARPLDLLAPARLALIALAGVALLMTLLAPDARAAYTAGTPLSMSNQYVTGVAVNQSSRDVYVSRSGDTFVGPGELARFSSAGANLGCTIPVSLAVDGAGGVAIDPVTNNVYMGIYGGFGSTYDMHTFSASCTSRVGTAYAIIPPPSLILPPQPATDAAGNLYLPNEGDDTVKKFQPNGTPIPLANPIAGLANPGSVALDSAGNIYVAETGIPIANVNEQQRVTFDGTWTNDVDTFALGNLPGDCAASSTATITYKTSTSSSTGRTALIRSALEAQCGANFSVSSSGTGANSSTTITFSGRYAGQNVGALTCSGSKTCTVTTPTEGSSTPAVPAKVSRFAPDGTPAGTFLNDPNVSSVTVDKSTGEVFIGLGKGSTFHIEKYNSAGTRLDDFGASLFGDGSFYNQLAVDETSGTVYATDAGQSQVEVFNFIPEPTITGLSPDHGSPAGGNQVIITGTNLSGATNVRFGTNDATGVTVDSPTQIRATAPAGTPVSTVNVSVTTPGGTSADTAADDYDYDAIPAPAISSISPNHGPAAGGTEVTITGTDFTGATAVRFGATNATTFTVDSATQIRATAPAGTRGTTVGISVTAPGGTSADTAADNYAYDLDAPAITSISPNHGPAAGGTVVTITGTDFTGATAVRFGANNATGVTVDSATQIRATAPAGTRGTTINVSVITPSGTSADTAADNYTYDLDPPAITAISPNHGPAAGGTVVTITGTDFTGATAVRFGANNATGVTVDSSTQIRATAPAGTRGTTVNVSVTTPSGTSANVAADDYRYDLASFALTVNKGGTGSGSVTCNGGPCAATYVEGTRVTLAASASSGSSFTGWSGAGCSGTGSCEVTINADTAVSATFTADPAPPPPPPPADSDGDGVIDANDTCPTVAAATANGCPQAANKLGPCVKKANEAYTKSLKAAKKKKGKARAKAIKKAKKKKTRSVSRCKASFSRPAGR